MGTFLVFACLTGLLISTTEVHAQTTTPYFASDVFGHHYARHVQMVYQNKMTFIALSSTQKDDPHIWAYDHQLGKWEGPVKIDDNLLPPSDQHGNPSLAVDQKGYIHVWYGGHGKIREKSSRFYARSKNPYDIRTWIYPDFANNITYPTPFTTKEGCVYCFFRAGNHSSCYKQKY